MSIWNHTYKFIDFDFVELRGVYPALRGLGSSFTPAPGGAKNRTPLEVELSAAKINLLPPRLRVAASAFGR